MIRFWLMLALAVGLCLNPKAWAPCASKQTCCETKKSCCCQPKAASLCRCPVPEGRLAALPAPPQLPVPASSPPSPSVSPTPRVACCRQPRQKAERRARGPTSVELRAWQSCLPPPA